MRRLADQVVLSKSGVTRLIDRLVADGLVERSTCSTDARGAEAVLTEAGLAGCARRRAPTCVGSPTTSSMSSTTPTSRSSTARCAPSPTAPGPMRATSGAARPVRRGRPTQRGLTPVVAGRLYAGTSGFAYPGWSPRFYPAGARAPTSCSSLRGPPRRGRAQQHLLPVALCRQGRGMARGDARVVPLHGQGPARRLRSLADRPGDERAVAHRARTGRSGSGSGRSSSACRTS